MNLSKRRMKRKFVRVPSGKAVLHVFKGKPSDHHCPICGAILHLKTGRKRPGEVSKLSATERRISRPYGGHLCTQCTRKLFSLRAMLGAGELKPEEVDIRFKKYL